MQKASIRKKIQELYKLGSAGGIFWGLGAGLFDLLIKGSPIGPLYISIVSCVTTPLYATINELTSHSPVLLWITNSIMAVFYLLIGYGVKMTSSALSGVWGVLVQKITSK